MGRNMAVVVVDEDGKERAVHKIAQGAHLKVDEGDVIKRGQRIAEWDPYTRSILTEVDGVVDFEDLLEGVSVNEQSDETTGITNRVIMDWRANPRGSALRPAIVVKDKAGGKVLKLQRGGEARYLLSVEAILSVEPGKHVKAGDALARISLESAKTRDITGGLPRVAELFEARRPKDHAIIAEISGTVHFGRDYKNKRRVVIQPDEEGIDPVEYLLPKGKHLAVQEGDRIEKGEFILDGNPAPHDILAIKGVEELASFLVNEIQEVYRLQGVTINDKHIEVIVRQMLQKVEVSDAGDTDFLKSEQQTNQARKVVLVPQGLPADCCCWRPSHGRCPQLPFLGFLLHHPGAQRCCQACLHPTTQASESICCPPVPHVIGEPPTHGLWHLLDVACTPWALLPGQRWPGCLSSQLTQPGFENSHIE